MDIKDNNNVDRQVSQSDNLRFASADRESVLLYSGQPKIIQAWSDCMRDHGGLKLRFEPNGSLFSNDVLLHIEYWKRGGPGLDVQPNMKLHQPVHITQAKKLVDANKCLQLTTIYRPGSYCDVQIQTASLWDSFSVAMPFVDDKGNPASVSAFLPVRAELKTESKKWPSQGTDIMLYAYANESVAEPNRIANRQVNADPGFFILDSISSTFSGNTSNCNVKGSPNNDGGASANLVVEVTKAEKKAEQCFGHFKGTQVRFYWDPPPPKRH